jgi:hypothetical protein
MQHMTKLVASLALAVTILAAAGTAQADSMYGNALRDQARTNGTITPHGVFDGL